MLRAAEDAECSRARAERRGPRRTRRPRGLRDRGYRSTRPRLPVCVTAATNELAPSLSRVSCPAAAGFRCQNYLHLLETEVPHFTCRAEQGDAQAMTERRTKQPNLDPTEHPTPAEPTLDLVSWQGGEAHNVSKPLKDPALFGPAADDNAPRESRYVTDRLHAEGGIGQVWLARDVHLNRDVALKTLREELQHRTRAMRRFLKEAEITGQLEHPGIVPVYELIANPATGRPFYAMRFVRGRTLAKAIRSYHEQRLVGDTDPLVLPTLLNALVAICNTVAYAHSRGVVHRDLKGDNVLLGDFGEVIVLDWGVAKVLGTADDESSLTIGNFDTEPEIDQTLQGDVVGTPAFMAPEQASGRLELIDARTDIYGLGAILYEILTGQPPFCGANTVEILEKVRREDPVPPHLLWPEVPRTLEAACLKALAKDQAYRDTTATALGEEIQTWQEVQRRRAEEEMRRSRERFELAVRGSQDGLWDWDLQTNEVFFSARWKGILGYEDDEIPNELNEWEKRLHPDERERVLAANFAHITGDTSHYEYEYRLRHKDGSYRWILARGVALRDKSGKAYRMAGSHVDITAWKELEAAYRRSQQRCHDVMAAAPCGILVVDADDQILEANRVAATLLGQTIAALQGRTLRSLWATAIPRPGDSAASDREPLDMDAIMESGQGCIVGFPRPDSQICWVSVTATQVSESADETRKSRYIYFTSAPL